MPVTAFLVSAAAFVSAFLGGFLALRAVSYVGMIIAVGAGIRIGAAFFDLIHKTLLEGDDVKMSGFGNFNIRRKAPRPGRNPRTGEAIPIKARHVVTFHASHKLKGVVQGDTPPADEFE